MGELVVKAAEGGRFGVFATEQTWPVYVRFSNGSGVPQPDKVTDVRGFAMKLVGVPGKKLIPGLEDAQTQDFLFIQDPVLPFRNADEFMVFVRAAKDGPAKLPLRLISGFGFFGALQVIARAVKSVNVKSIALQEFHTASPISFGPSAAKLALFPLQSSPPPTATGGSALREDLASRLKTGSLSWSLKATVFQDDATTPIEDTSVKWPAKWIELGTLTLPVQDPDSKEGTELSEYVSQLSFDPWHAVEEHRPLGSIMRARAVAYRESVIGRSAAPEPASVRARVA
jgi:hypothetical protein